MTSLSRHLASLSALATLLALATPAPAQTSSEKAAAAQALFDEAMALMKSGKATEACPKLAESQRLDPGMATQYRLAECYEQTGRIASAWAVFIEVADAAKNAGLTDREKVARKRAEVLAPRLSRLTITVPPNVASTPGLEIERDGEPVGKALWGTPIPIDPGEHTITASAPAKKPWQTTSAAAQNATKLDVQIPMLEDAPAISPPPPPSLQDHIEPPKTPRSKAPVFILGGVALVAAGAGVAMLLLEGGKQSNMTQLSTQIAHDGGRCTRSANGTITGTDPRCADVYDTAQTADLFHNIGIGMFIGAGASAVAALGYLLWPEPAATQKKTTGVALRATPILGSNHGGLVVSGSF